MKVDIKVPSVGESVTEATVTTLMKKSGSMVKADEEILELETDKVNQVLYAPASGKLTLTVNAGDTVKIGQTIGLVDTDAQGATQETAPKEKAKVEAPKPPKKEEKPLEKKKTEEVPARQFISDYIEEIKTGKKETARAEPSKKEAVSPQIDGKTTRKKMSSLRKTIAQRLVAAKNQTAMLTTFNEVDMSNIMAIRTKEQDAFLKRNGVKLGFMSFFVKAATAALKAYPQVNAMIDGDDLVLFHTYDIGVAVSTERGLLVPVLKGCDALSFGQIEKAISDFAIKAREGTISIEDLRGGSFTITNGGVFGSLLSTPIINPPQSAILGMHSIVKRAVVINDQIVIRPMMYLALSYDHRVIDGREAVQCLVHMKQNLEDPSRLLLDL